MIKQNRSVVFGYMFNVIKRKNCTPFIVNGIEDHLHILTHLHPSVSLASLVKDIKLSSHIFIKRNSFFPEFKCWQKGYGAFTYSKEAKPNLIRYIENQEIHHQGISFEKEYISLLDEQKVAYDFKYVFD